MHYLYPTTYIGMINMSTDDQDAMFNAQAMQRQAKESFRLAEHSQCFESKNTVSLAILFDHKSLSLRICSVGSRQMDIPSLLSAITERSVVRKGKQEK